MNYLKDIVIMIIGLCGGFVSWLYGGWNSALTTLVIFMTINFVSGLIVAGAFQKSNKTSGGALESRAGWIGICKKLMTLIIVAMAYRLDLLLNTTFVKDATVVAFISNEAISIIENAGLMGIPIPTVVKKALEILNKKNEDIKGNLRNDAETDINYEKTDKYENISKEDI